MPRFRRRIWYQEPGVYLLLLLLPLTSCESLCGTLKGNKRQGDVEPAALQVSITTGNTSKTQLTTKHNTSHPEITENRIGTIEVGHTDPVIITMIGVDPNGVRSLTGRLECTDANSTATPSWAFKVDGAGSPAFLWGSKTITFAEILTGPWAQFEPCALGGVTFTYTSIAKDYGGNFTHGAPIKFRIVEKGATTLSDNGQYAITAWEEDGVGSTEITVAAQTIPLGESFPGHLTLKYYICRSATGEFLGPFKETIPDRLGLEWEENKLVLPSPDGAPFSLFDRIYLVWYYTYVVDGGSTRTVSLSKTVVLGGSEPRLTTTYRKLHPDNVVINTREIQVTVNLPQVYSEDVSVRVQLPSFPHTTNLPNNRKLTFPAGQTSRTFLYTPNRHGDAPVTGTITFRYTLETKCTTIQQRCILDYRARWVSGGAVEPPATGEVICK